jgi:putative DNA primase/helicase
MKENHASLEQKCLSHMAENGIAFSGPLDTDGNIHRFSGGPNKGKKDEWYIAFRGTSNSGCEYLNCSYGSWKASTTVDGKHTFTSYDNDCTLDFSERQQFQEEIKKKKEEAENQIKELREAAAKEAQRIWNEYEDIQALESHLEYCTAKGISPVGVRFGNNPQGYPSVVIPIRNSKEEIRSLQFISVGREGRVYKTFLSGGEKSGNFFAIGELTDAASICVCEGYATGVSVNLAFKDLTDHPVVIVAFDCHNLESVVAAIRNKCPKSSIVICADDDVETPGNPGRSKAEAVAREYGCKVSFPNFPDDFKLANGKKPTDFNDLHIHFGIEEVSTQINQAQRQEKQDDNNESTVPGEVKKGRNGIQFRTAHSLAQEPPKTNWLIKLYLDEGSLSVLFGEPGSMKSFLAIDIGYCIATGYPWHGFPVRKTGSVFYIAGEGFAGLSKRFRAWSLANDVDLKDIPFFISDRPAQLLDPSNLKDVVLAIEELKNQHGQPVFVIIDTLNRNFGPGDENKTEDMTAFVNAVDTAIRMMYGCAVLIVHHSPLNDSGRARGASALRGALDWEYRLSKQGDIRKLTATKVKDYEPPPDIFFRPKSIFLEGWVDEEDGEVMTSCVLETADERVIEYKSDAEKLKGPQKIAFDCLLKLFELDNCNKSEGVDIDAWRDAAYKANISSANTIEASKKAFQRAVNNLRDKGYVEANNNYWKPCGTRDRDGTFRGHVPN